MPLEVPPPSEAVMALESCSLHVDIRVDPSQLPAFLAEFQKVFDLVTAEPECSYFEVFEDVDEPGHLRWVENWNAPTTWLAAVQLQKEYYKPYLAATDHMIVKPRQFMILKRFGGSLVVQKEENLKKV